ncbi:MAG: hypothetical protein ACK4YP_19005, partial [Myxococcota bacterium]
LRCGDSAAEAPGRDGIGGGHDAGSSAPPPPRPCTTNADCPTAHTCEQSVCVPPENETSRLSERPPVASPRYVYALNPASDGVARIDPRTLAIEAIPVGTLPVDLAALPGEDAAVALSYTQSSLALIDSTTLPSRVLRVPLKRQYSRLSVSQDGAFAIAWPDPARGAATATGGTGAEGIVTVIDLKAARLGRPAEQVRFERATGFRVTDVVFRTDAGVATRAFVFAKDTVAIIDLQNLASSPLPLRVALPPAIAQDVRTREVISDASGQHLVLRSTVSPELAYFDGASIRSVPLPEIATDLDLLPDGSAAIAALRVSRQLAVIEIPADLLDPTGIQLFDTGGPAIGQVALPPVMRPRMFAFAFSNATVQESFVRLELPSGVVTPYTVEKVVDEIAIAPDGNSAVVLHRPNPTTTATDDYERAVDLDEGYSVVDVDTGYVQLKRTGKVKPGPFAFSPAGGYLGVALRDETARRYGLDAVNLSSLVASTLTLASAPLFMGPVPAAPGSSPHRIFISQHHPAGRISVVNLDDGQLRTATGFTLNSEIE